jgi:AGZA family xanthine/uracil permease-like MFS transporter
MHLQDLLAALGVIVNGLPQGLLALSFGFASMPTAIGFAIGAIGAALFGLVTPISFQAETITLVGTMGRNLEERLAMIFFEGLGMALIGFSGLLTAIVNAVGPEVTNGMMTGVGIMLTLVAVNMVKSRPAAGGASVAAGLLTYVTTKNLVYTIMASVVAATLVAAVRRDELAATAEDHHDGFRFRWPNLANWNVIRGGLALICLNIGATIAFGSITGNIAKTAVNLDHLTIISALADFGSSLFGGGPVQSIISATGAAPHPVVSAVLMMALMAVILLTGLLPRIGRKVPMESIAGFLFVLGAIVTVPINAKMAMAGNPLIGGTAAAVTATTDPFLGLLAGYGMKLLVGLHLF